MRHNKELTALLNQPPSIHDTSVIKTLRKQRRNKRILGILAGVTATALISTGCYLGAHYMTSNSSPTPSILSQAFPEYTLKTEEDGRKIYSNGTLTLETVPNRQYLKRSDNTYWTTAGEQLTQANLKSIDDHFN